LRRVADPKDALTEEAVLDLYRRLGFARGLAEETLSMVAVAAMVLAHVRENDRRRSPARAVGRERFEDEAFESAAMKPLRFKRLLAAREPEELAREMRRLVQLADMRLDVGLLAEAIFAWRHPERGDAVRTRWAYDYFAAGDAAPRDRNAATSASAA
jgi:CRISPR system Cascade subunit CasB